MTRAVTLESARGSAWWLYLLLGFSRFAWAVSAAPVLTCDETALRAALTEGSTVTFACDGIIALDQPIMVEKSVTLDATGHSVSLSGGELHRVIELRSGTLVLVGLSVINGAATNGAGIWVRGGKLVLEDIVFSNNVARPALADYEPTRGGALLVEDGWVRGTNVRWIHNVARNHDPLSYSALGQLAQGGAVWIGRSATVELSGCLLEGNRALGGWGGNQGVEVGLAGHLGGGGAIFNQGTLILSNSMVAGNEAVGGAGGVVGSLLPGGYAGGSGGPGQGGGLWNEGRAMLSLCRLEYNRCRGGEGPSGTPGVTSIAFPSGPGGAGAGGGAGGLAQGAGAFNQGELCIERSSLVGNESIGGQGGAGGQGGNSLGHGGEGAEGGAAQGGGLYHRALLTDSPIFESVSSVRMTNCTAALNRVEGGRGGRGGDAGPTSLLSGSPGADGGSGGAGGAAMGGGIAAADSWIWMVNITVASNAAVHGSGAAGGALRCGRTACGTNGAAGADGEIRGSAIAVWGENGGVHVANTIIASEGGAACGGPLIDHGNNLCSDQSAPWTSAWSLKGLNPRLEPLFLADASFVFPLRAASPAIDAGDDALGPPIDQKGTTRRQLAHVDIGAVEFVPDGFFIRSVERDSPRSIRLRGWGSAYTGFTVWSKVEAQAWSPTLQGVTGGNGVFEIEIPALHSMGWFQLRVP